jgi:hypothetical protein
MLWRRVFVLSEEPSSRRRRRRGEWQVEESLLKKLKNDWVGRREVSLKQGTTTQARWPLLSAMAMEQTHLMKSGVQFWSSQVQFHVSL